jgi:hypothetical protein
MALQSISRTSRQVFKNPLRYTFELPVVDPQYPDVLFELSYQQTSYSLGSLTLSSQDPHSGGAPKFVLQQFRKLCQKGRGDILCTKLSLGRKGTFFLPFISRGVFFHCNFATIPFAKSGLYLYLAAHRVAKTFATKRENVA